MDKYDICIIGAGPGGYVAAICAAQLGGKVCVIEKDELGGVCLNRGCIPTKTLNRCTEVLSNVTEASKFGIDVKDYSINFLKMVERSKEVVSRLRSGIDFLFKSRKITLVKDRGRIAGPTSVEVAGEKVEAKNIIVATGSSPQELPFLKFDGDKMLSSDDILNLKEIPKSLLIIGGGVIGCEFGSIYNKLRSEVTIIEMMDQILPTEDKEIAKKLEGILKRRGIKILTSTKVMEVEKGKDEVTAKLSNDKKIRAEKVLVCVGRSPNSSGLGLQEIDVKIEKGRILVDSYLRTTVPTIFAIGDVIGGHLLAHVASYEGKLATENALSKEKKIDYRVIPNCVYTDPEIGSVGLSENEANKAGYNVGVGKFPFTALGKAHAMGQTEGLIKIVGDKKTDKILGAQIFGLHATDLIAEIALAIKLGAKISQLADTVHAHPTLAEALQEAALSFGQKAIHLP